MQYEALKQLIDAEIARLAAARRILLEEPAQAPRKTASAAAATPAAPDAEPQVRVVADMQAGTEASTEKPSRALAARVPSRTRRTEGPSRRRPRARQPQELGALSGQIPRTPVAVSAADAVRSREALAREAQAREAHSRPKPEVPAGEGTLESLLKDLHARGNAA